MLVADGAAMRRWRRHSPAHERRYRLVSVGVERRGVKKIRRLTAFRLEAGPRPHLLSQQFPRSTKNLAESRACGISLAIVPQHFPLTARNFGGIFGGTF